MTQTTHPRGGWQQEEIDLLFSAVKEAAENGRPLRDVFSEVGGQLSRKPNSIRNFYYARVRRGAAAGGPAGAAAYLHPPRSCTICCAMCWWDADAVRACAPA